MPITTALEDCYPPVRMAKLKNNGSTRSWQDAEQQDLTNIAGGNAEWYDQSGKRFGSFSSGSMYTCHMTQQSLPLIGFYNTWENADLC